MTQLKHSPHSGPSTGGQLIVQSLQMAGVDTVFCVPGESFLEVLDALYENQVDMKLVTCRHENGASFMAEAYAKLMGRVGVCIVTRGPGACNGSIGVHTAFQDSSPMVYLIGHVRREDIGREAFQEVDFEQMFAPLAKSVRMIKSAADAPSDVAWAFEEAISGRPGPVVLIMPEDMLREEAYTQVSSPKEPSVKTMDEGDLERIHHRLMAAHRPLLMVGGSGWTAQARTEIVAFAEAMDIPVCCSMRRLDVFDNAHPCFVGEMGIAPNPNLVQRFKNSDLVLVVGARIGEMTSQGYTLLDAETSKSKLVHIHRDSAELGRVFPPAIGLSYTPEVFAHAAKDLSKPSDHWATWRAEARADYVAWQRPQRTEGPLDLAQCMMDLDGFLDDNVIVTVDAGNFSGWAQRYLSFSKGRRFLGPTNGAMGYGVPSGIAAQTAFPDRQCVTFVGDGGFGMTGQELATAVQQNQKHLILVFNNAMFGTIRMHQERRFPSHVVATDLHNPDFSALARAYGAYGDVVERTEQFIPAVERALASGTVAVLDVPFDGNIISTRTTLDAIRRAAEEQ